MATRHLDKPTTAAAVTATSSDDGDNDGGSSEGVGAAEEEEEETLSLGATLGCSEAGILPQRTVHRRSWRSF